MWSSQIHVSRSMMYFAPSVSHVQLGVGLKFNAHPDSKWLFWPMAAIWPMICCVKNNHSRRYVVTPHWEVVGINLYCIRMITKKIYIYIWYYHYIYNLFVRRDRERDSAHLQNLTTMLIFCHAIRPGENPTTNTAGLWHSFLFPRSTKDRLLQQQEAMPIELSVETTSHLLVFMDPSIVQEDFDNSHDLTWTSAELLMISIIENGSLFCQCNRCPYVVLQKT